MGQPPDVKRQQLIDQMAGYLVRPYLLSDELFRKREAFGVPTFEECVANLPICEGCKERVIVGDEGLIDDKYCATCAHKHAA